MKNAPNISYRKYDVNTMTNTNIEINLPRMQK